jgi:hypothetical protein
MPATAVGRDRDRDRGTAPDTGHPLNVEYLPVHEVEEILADPAAVPGIGADPFTHQMAHSGKDYASTEEIT